MLPESQPMVSPPDWLSVFVNGVTANIHSFDVLSPLGCHFHCANNVWEVTVFASKTEIVGGSQDGQLIESCFSIDIKGLLGLLTDIQEISWQSNSLGPMDDLGAHLSVHGNYDGKVIWLRVTSVAPEQFEAGRRIHVNQKSIEEVW